MHIRHILTQGRGGGGISSIFNEQHTVNTIFVNWAKWEIYYYLAKMTVVMMLTMAITWSTPFLSN